MDILREQAHFEQKGLALVKFHRRTPVLNGNTTMRLALLPGPRFSTLLMLACTLGSSTSLLKAPLSRLGMPTAFNDLAADFSRMDGTRRLHISYVFHKAWGEVNEEGTEAAAATGVVMTQQSLRLPAPTPVFRADHPFVFLIRHSGSGRVLFLGRLANPAT